MSSPEAHGENGYVEPSHGRLRDELLDREIFHTLLEAKVLIEQWRKHYNHIRPQSALGCIPPAPEARVPWPPYKAGTVNGFGMNLNTGSVGGGGSTNMFIFHFYAFIYNFN